MILQKRRCVFLAISIATLTLCGAEEPQDSSRKPFAILGGSEFRNPESVSSLVWSPDGRLLVSKGSGLHVWRMSDGEEIRTIPGGSAPRFLNDGRLVWFAAGWHAADAATGKETDPPILGSAQSDSLDISPDLSCQLERHKTGHVFDEAVELVRVSDHSVLMTAPPRESIRDNRLMAPSGVFSPDGLVFATWAQDGVLRVHAMQSMASIATLEPKDGFVQEAILSCNGTYAAAQMRGDGSYDSFIYVWDVRSGSRLLAFPGRGSFAFSAKGDRIAWVHEYQLRTEIVVTDVATGEHLYFLPATSEWPSCLAFSPDGTVLAAGCGHSVRFWNLSTGAEITRCSGHLEAVRSLEFTVNGKTLVTGSDDGTVRFWDVASRKESMTLTDKDRVTGIALSADGKRIAIARQNEPECPSGLVCVREIASGRTLWDSGYLGDVIESLTFHDGDRELITVGPWGSVVRRNSETGAELQRFSEHYAPRTFGSTAVSPHGALIACVRGSGYSGLGWGVPSGTLELWDSSGQPLLLSEQSVPINAQVAWTPEGRFLLIVQDEAFRTVDAWNQEPSREFKVVEKAPPDPHQWHLELLAVTPDGTHAFYARDGRLRLIELGSGKSDFEVGSVPGKICTVAISPDGRTFVTGLEDGRVLLWDAEPPPGAGLNLDDAWESLGSEDAFRAREAGWGFTRGGSKAVEFLAARLSTPLKMTDLQALLAKAAPDPAEPADDRPRAGCALPPEDDPGDAWAFSGVGPARSDPLTSRLSEPLNVPLPLLRLLRAFEALARMPDPAATKLLRWIGENEPWPRLRGMAAQELARRGEPK